MARQLPRTPPQPPPIFDITAESLLEQARQMVKDTTQLENKVVTDISPFQASFETVVLPLAHNENRAKAKIQYIALFRAVSPDPETRAASSQAVDMIDKAELQSSTREDLFVLVDAVWKKHKALDSESQLMLEKRRQQYIDNGLKLPKGPQRDRFKEIGGR